MKLLTTTKQSPSSFIQDGEVMEQCENHTPEEWLEIMQQKSIAQGKALSWYQIKQDPSLNHKEIFDKLGPYVNYERKLMPKSISGAESPTTSAKLQPKPQQVQAKPTRKTSNTKSKASGVKEGLTISVPIGDFWEDQSMVIISALMQNGSEKPVDISQLSIIQQPVNIRNASLANLLSGQHRTCRIREVTIESTRITLGLVWKRGNTNYVDSGDERKIVFRAANGQRLKLFIAVVNVEADGGCDHYAVCDADWHDGHHKITVLESDKIF